jgi:hypothetical protein
MRGRFLGVAGHLAALNSGDDGLRYFRHDLNRLFREDSIAAAVARPPSERSPDEHELLELVGILRGAAASEGCCVLLDLHTVSSPSPAFCCIEDSLPARRLGLAVGLPLVLGFEEELEGLLIDYATNVLGMPALVVEAGAHDDPASVRVHAAAIWAVLGRLGMVDSGGRTISGGDTRRTLLGAGGRHAGRVFDLRARASVGEPPMVLLDGAQAFARVWKGITPVATRDSGAGGRETVWAPADGVLFMPNRQKRRSENDDAFFILRPVWRRFVGVSAWLRVRPWAHRALAALPGVARDAGDPDTLRVDHSVAVILARDTLHLFGYRVLHRPLSGVYRRRLTRALLGLWVLPLALLRAAAGAPAEGGEIWIARRRRLDVHPPRCEALGAGIERRGR